MTMSNKTILILSALLLILQVKSFADDSLPESATIGPPADFAASSVLKIWEGEIGDKKVAYFRSGKEQKVEEILVVIQDNMPLEFRRFEYFDKDCDGELNFVKIKTFREGGGWEKAEINENNKYALEFANAKFKEYLGKVKEKIAGRTAE